MSPLGKSDVCHAYPFLLPPARSRFYVCESRAPLPFRIKIQPFIRPNSCQQHKRQRLVKPSKQTQEADSMSAQLSSPPPPPLLRLLLFHYLNMTGSPCSLSKAGDRWNWWALRVQRETSGQARVIGGTKERCASGCSPSTLLASTLWIQLTSLTLFLSTAALSASADAGFNDEDSCSPAVELQMWREQS